MGLCFSTRNNSLNHEIQVCIIVTTAQWLLLWYVLSLMALKIAQIKAARQQK